MGSICCDQQPFHTLTCQLLAGGHQDSGESVPVPFCGAFCDGSEVITVSELVNRQALDLDFALIDLLSAVENVELPLLVNGVSPRTAFGNAGGSSFPRSDQMSRSAEWSPPSRALTYSLR